MDSRTFRRSSVGQRRLRKALALIEELIVKAKLITSPHEASPPATLVNPSAPTKPTGGSIIHPAAAAKPAAPLITPGPKPKAESGLVTPKGEKVELPSMGPGSPGYKPPTKIEHQPAPTMLSGERSGSVGFIHGPSGETISPHLGRETMVSGSRPEQPKPSGEIIVPGAPKPAGDIVAPGPQPKPGAELTKPVEMTAPGTAARQKEIIGTGTSAITDLPPGPERTAAMKQGAAVLGSRIREQVAAAPPAARGGPSAPAVPETPPVAGLPQGEPSGAEGTKPGEKPGPLPGEKGYKPVDLPPSGWDPFKKLSQRPGPNVLGWYGFGHGLGMTAASPGGGPTQLGMWTGRGVAQVHGLLNRRAGTAPRAYRGEMTRLAREGELTRRQQLGRMQGEAGGVVTQSAMTRSLFIRVGEEELTKSRIKPKRPRSRLFVSIYSNPALFGRGKKEEDKEPTAELPSLMPKVPKPRTITLFGKAKNETIPDPQNEDIQPDEEDGVASALVGDDDLVVKADRVAKLRAHYAERKRLWSLIPHEHRGPDKEGLPQADGPYAHLREPIAAHDYAAHLHGVAGRDPSRQREADEASHQAWIESNKISKAGAAQESTGRWTLEDPIQAKREHEHGLERQPTGISGGPTPDLPERGRDWHGTVPGVPDEPQDDDEEPAEKTWAAPKPILESEKKEKKPEPVIRKALVPYQFAQQRARDILKALPDLSVGPDLTPREMEFLKSQGLDDEDIIRGSYRITPRMQTEFRRYMTDRVFKSLSGLRRSW